MNPISFQLENAVAHITLRRPEIRNVLDPRLVRALADRLLQADRDPAVNAILLDGEGPAFCCGLEPGGVWISSTAEDVESLETILRFGLHASKPLVVAVQGAAIGAGMALVANAHVALAAQGTSFGLIEIRSGQWPFLSWDSIERVLGRRRALELSLTGRVFTAADALAWGLIHELTQPSELEDRAFATATLLASAPPRVVRRAIEWSRSPVDASAEFLANMRSAEAAEGAAAIEEKRRPRWPAAG